MKITRSKRFHARNTDPNIVSGTCLSCETGVCTQREEEKTRTKGGSLASVIPELENCVVCEGSRKEGGKAAGWWGVR